MGNYQSIIFDIADGVATITLNRPDRLNAFSEQLHGELAEATTRAAEDPAIRAVLLTGAGRGFCAGQDLTERVMGSDGKPAEAGAALDRWYNPLVRRIRNMPKPVVAAINGVAAGAGANVALACDIVIAARSASFIQAFAKIALIPDSGGTWFLPRLLGDARARALALTADKLPAETAAEWGLIWKCVDDDKLMAEAGGLARHLATQPTKGLGLIKQAMNHAATATLDEQLDREARLQRQASQSEDFREGVKAFLEKRPAKFVGR